MGLEGCKYNRQLNVMFHLPGFDDFKRTQNYSCECITGDNG